MGPKKNNKMTDNVSHNKEEPKTDDEPIDPTLDVTSEHFDPLKALYAKNIKLPFEDAKVYDNINQFQSSLNKKQFQNDKKVDKTNKAGEMSNVAKASTSRAATEGTTKIFQRRFLPHQSRFEYLFLL